MSKHAFDTKWALAARFAHFSFIGTIVGIPLKLRNSARCMRRTVWRRRDFNTLQGNGAERNPIIEVENCSGLWTVHSLIL